jgi:predicted transcriptional regulator
LFNWQSDCDCNHSGFIWAMATGRRGWVRKGALDARTRSKTETARKRAPRQGTKDETPRFSLAASILRLMGVTENLRLLILVLSGPRTISELAVATGKANYLVARRLTKLSRVGLIVAQSDATYKLRGKCARRLVSFAVDRIRGNRSA